MKKHLFLLVCIGLSLVGCHQEETLKAPKEMTVEATHKEMIEVKPFIVKEQQNDGYKKLKEVVEPSEIRTVIEIIENADWEENIEVQMAHPPEYRFSLGSVNYAIWVTPNGDRLEIIAEGQSKYIKMAIKDSETLFKMITGNEL